MKNIYTLIILLSLTSCSNDPDVIKISQSEYSILKSKSNLIESYSLKIDSLEIENMRIRESLFNCDMALTIAEEK
ncbi:hypothetical protein CXF67_09025 [Psychroflexus sp. MES1-P1E]|nr:hypothetical protein CXF67_09025 [Psychroflexus sp. MES1-P1E]